MLLESFATTDVGLVRSNNEDVFRELKREKFFVLADGMGGHPAGEIAATKAVEYMCSEIHNFHRKPPQSLHIEELKSKMFSFTENTNLWVHHLGISNPKLKGMGTTLCSIFFYQTFAVYSHVGDSRIYRFRNGKLLQLTRDHLVQSEPFIEIQNQVSWSKKILTQAIGTSIAISPEVDGDVAMTNDIYLLCSDGLSDLVPFEVIEECISSSNKLPKIGEKLIEFAKTCGGHDNITLVLVRLL